MTIAETKLKRIVIDVETGVTSFVVEQSFGDAKAEMHGTIASGEAPASVIGAANTQLEAKGFPVISTDHAEKLTKQVDEFRKASALEAQ